MSINFEIARRQGLRNVHALPSEFDGDFKLWRYITLTKLLLLLENKYIYLAPLTAFDDVFEGTLPKTHPDALKELQEKYDMPNDPVKALDHHMKIVRKYTFINCWHISEYESAAMWDIYSKIDESIAIQSTFKRIHEEVGDQAQMSAIGYIDYEKDYLPMGNMLYPSLYKRKSFAYEQEFRIAKLDITEMVNGDEPSSFKKVDIDLSKLVEKIYVAPNAPDFFQPLIKSVCNKYGFEFEIIKSRLNDSPFY